MFKQTLRGGRARTCSGMWQVKCSKRLECVCSSCQLGRMRTETHGFKVSQIYSAWWRYSQIVLTNSHDYNEEIGNGGSFERTHDWKDIMPEWKSYVSKEFGEHKHSMSEVGLDHRRWMQKTRKLNPMPSSKRAGRHTYYKLGMMHLLSYRTILRWIWRLRKQLSKLS